MISDRILRSSISHENGWYSAIPLDDALGSACSSKISSASTRVVWWGADIAPVELV